MMSCRDIESWHDIRDLERQRGRRQSRGVQGWGEKKWIPEMAASKSPVDSRRNANLQLAKASLRFNQENKRTVQHLLNLPHSVNSDVTWRKAEWEEVEKTAQANRRVKKNKLLTHTSPSCQ